MNLKQRLNEALENRLFLSDQVLEVDTDYVFEREDSVVFFVCVVLNSTDDAYVMRLEGDFLEIWIHVCSYDEAVNYFEQIEDEFTPDETPDEIDYDVLKDIFICLGSSLTIIDYPKYTRQKNLILTMNDHNHGVLVNVDLQSKSLTYVMSFPSFNRAKDVYEKLRID